MNARIAILITAGFLLVGSPAWSTEHESAEGAVAEPSAMPTAMSTGKVERATFTTAVLDREPQDMVTELSNDNVQVLYFTEITEAMGDTVVHRWEWNGTVVAEVSFDIRGPRWRVHSSKNLDPMWLGEWTVVTLDSSGRELQRDTFVYTEAPETGTPPPASPVP